MRARGTIRGAVTALVVAALVASGAGSPAPAGTSSAAGTAAVAGPTGGSDRILPRVAGRPAWLVVRRGVGGMQGAHGVEGRLTFTGDQPYVLRGRVDPSSGSARVTYQHVSTDPEAIAADALPTEIRLDGTTAYRRLSPPMRSDLLADWYSFDLTDADPATTPTEVLVAQWFLDAPKVGLEVESWTERPATAAGTTGLRHFRGTAALADTVLLLARSKGFLPRLAVDVWADRAGRIRRVRWQASPDPAYRGKRAPTVILDATYRSLGSPLVVTRPVGRVIDASKIYD